MDSKIKKTSWFYCDFNRQLNYLHFCENSEFCEALAYLLTFKKYQNLNVVPHKFSIEISNIDIHIFIIHTVFFQQIEYLNVKEYSNAHFVSFNPSLSTMHEFNEIKNEIKFINKKMLMATVEMLTTNKLLSSMNDFVKTDGL